MRNWPYAYALGNSADSKVKGKFDVVPLPAGSAADKSAATLGGWNLAVSKYSKHPKEATQLALFLASAETQKANALFASHLPTIMSLYDDADIAKAQPIIAQANVELKTIMPAAMAVRAFLQARGTPSPIISETALREATGTG